MSLASPLRQVVVSERATVGFGAAEDCDQLRSLVRDPEQPPASLPHIGAPGDQLFPCLGGRSEYAQVGDALPLRRVRLAARHSEESGGAISRVLFGHARWPDGHLSGIAVASHLVRPTRSSNDPGRVSLPIWPCSDWGLPCHGRYRPRGGLLPHRFTLALETGRFVFCGPVRRLAAPRRYLAVCPAELALSSTHHSNRHAATIAPHPPPRQS